MNCIYLPVGEEDDTFDSEKLENWIVRPQKVFRGKVEEEESIQGHRDAERYLSFYMIEYIFIKTHDKIYNIYDQSIIRYIIKIDQEESIQDH